MTVSKKLKSVYLGFFDGLETWVANRISDITEWRFLLKYGPKETVPRALRRQVRDYWSKYTRISPRWAWYYSSKNGISSPKYIPNTLIYTKIDQHFNNRKMGYGFNDKNYYALIFPGLKQPETVVRNIGGILLDEKYHLLTKDEAIARILNNDDVICKPSLESGSGRSIQFWNSKTQSQAIESFIDDPSEIDYIVQKLIRQHPDLNLVHDGSVNSVRIVSLLMPEGVYILSSNLRMGVGESRIDNVTAGGISCGIEEDGFLKECATTYYTGESIYSHPQGLVFKGFRVPSYGKAVEMVKKAHPLIPHFRLVSWDIAIDESGDSVLIEANMRKGGINLNQFNNGPLFGDLTDRVLNEVFGE